MLQKAELVGASPCQLHLELELQSAGICCLKFCCMDPSQPVAKAHRQEASLQDMDGTTFRASLASADTLLCRLPCCGSLLRRRPEGIGPYRRTSKCALRFRPAEPLTVTCPLKERPPVAGFGCLWVLACLGMVHHSCLELLQDHAILHVHEPQDGIRVGCNKNLT